MLQKEQRKAEKERRKEKKREKKEKKKEKKEKSGINGDDDKKSHGRKEVGSANHKSCDFQKKIEYETEQLERSGLSEEHGLPSCIPNLCDSSDSTQNSGKRKRHSSISKGSHNQSTMLRIRLPLVRHRDPEELLSKEQLCSTSGANGITANKMADVSPNIKHLCSVSGRTEVPAQSCSEPAPAASAAALLNLCNSPSLLSDAQLRDIIENWVIPPIQNQCTDVDDQSWLFDMPSKREPKRSKVSDVATCYDGSMWPPRACYLPEADIYALPYTVPF
ncbi:hypothetical protein AQUCO_00700023v1 [Aquilegia coerulea]|uniref:Uncharacterized protein n=1 Tax=Aquilegia coerulea TaxID=218851 RepID=A0A2G5EI77_AQUCA|nr:hypothetical protein AQUCO_00700023v1 [Aquilegia coerulea]